MVLRIFSLIFILSISSACSSVQRNSSNDFKIAAREGSGILSVKTSTVDRNVKDVLASLVHKSAPCLNKTFISRKPVWVAWNEPLAFDAEPLEVTTRFRTLVRKLGPNRAEWLVQIQQWKDSSHKEPDQESLLTIAELSGLSKTTTRVKTYGPNKVYDGIPDAVHLWARDSRPQCPPIE